MANHGRKIIDSSVMAASELIENAIKYGKSAGHEKDIEILVVLDGKRIQITVSNPVESCAEYEEVKRHIERIGGAGDAGTLFVDRMVTLLEEKNTDGKTMLGLIRIANEGGFDLECGMEDNLLTISATNEFAVYDKEY